MVADYALNMRLQLFVTFYEAGLRQDIESRLNASEAEQLSSFVVAYKQLTREKALWFEVESIKLCAGIGVRDTEKLYADDIDLHKQYANMRAESARKMMSAFTPSLLQEVQGAIQQYEVNVSQEMLTGRTLDSDQDRADYESSLSTRCAAYSGRDPYNFDYMNHNDDE